MRINLRGGRVRGGHRQFSRGRGYFRNHSSGPGNRLFSTQFGQNDLIGNSQHQNSGYTNNAHNTFTIGADLKSECKFEFKELLELSSEDRSAILSKFNTETIKFNNTLKDEMKPDTIVIFMKCLSKLCNAHFDYSKSTIIIKICQSKFTSTLEQYLLDLQYSKMCEKQYDTFFWDDSNDFWKNTFSFYEQVMATIPNTAVENLPRLFNIFKMTIESLRTNHTECLNPELQQKFDNLQIQFTATKDKMKQILKKRVNPNKNVEVPNEDGMRPEIANLIHPSIYHLLEKDPYVYEYPDVKGFQNNLFFINHNMPESKDEIISSYSNEHEANYMIRLARYLIQQQYDGSEITILCTYLGQMFTLQKIKKSYDILKDVKICVLDNYQGEKNKIILLTLVRSNSDNNTRFLEIANRICVALSRAKHGLYIIGNMSNLMHSSELWKTINDKLVKQNSIGPSIPLLCQNHGIITDIQTIDDFMKVAEGGCQSQCNILLKCGHICQRLCHFDTNNHENVMCKMSCQRECVLEHKCKLLCFQKCHCEELVPKILECQHENIVKCHIEPKYAKCSEKIMYKLPQCSHEKVINCGDEKKHVKCEIPCRERLPCGHACINFCHKDKDPEHLLYECKEPCSKKYKNCVNDHQCQIICYKESELCVIPVLKKRKNCSHTENVPCHKDINSIPCTKNCTKLMSCGHICQNKCYEPCKGCSVQVKRLKSCGHEVYVECSKNVGFVKCTERCSLNLKCGHRCLNKCYEKCGTKPCQEMVPNPFKSLCGHDFQIMCQDSNLGKLGSFLTMKYCKNPCGEILHPCEHPCQGTCGECKGRLHTPCAQKCENLLICGHICKDPCREYCSVCRNPCDTACIHSKCNLICGLPCKPCIHKCEKKCPHSECTKNCGEICDREPCSEPCPKKLKCNHNCYGLCGEQCPNICKICRPDEIEIIFGDEDEEDARFIKIIDCGHVIEVNGMDVWVENCKDASQIGYPRCPICNKCIKRTPRYYRDIIQTFEDVQKVKVKNYGDSKIIKRSFEVFYSNMVKLDTDKTSFVFDKVPLWKDLISKIKSDPLINSCLKVISEKRLWERKVIQLSQVDIDNFNIQINILTYFANIFVKNHKKVETLPLIDQTDFILKSMLACKRKFTQQRVENFNDEIDRIDMMLRLEMLNSKHPNINIDIQEKLENTLFSNLPYGPKKAYVEDLYCNFSLKLDYISAQDKKMVVRAIGLRQGHWYKCPNGHPYCIGECGRAIQISKCPECQCPIGGSNNTLLASNKLALEMNQV